ncbi:putative JmjC domain protein, partial [Talaromyces proteolyticus]
MPAQRPRAAFEAIPPNLDVAALVESTPNFEFVVRIHRNAIYEQGLDNFEKLVRLHVVIGGQPLVVEGYDANLEKWIFAERWLRDNYATKTENARNLTTKSNLPLTIGHYLNNMHMLTEQWNLTNFADPERQRIYLKDIDCPTVWFEKLKETIPPFLSYLNESTGDTGVSESNIHGPGIGRGLGIARAGDLMSSLPAEMRAENLMCYIGHEGTYTPCHQEMCASLGHNIMVEASTGAFEYGKRTKPGSSIWFMTETSDHRLVSEYWSSVLGHDIDLEDHFAQISAWKVAPFKTYVVEQKVGDFILIPPLAPHQVWNRGTRTMKVAWNRTTVETLEMALNEALPRARVVCRDEQYKNKSIIYFSLDRYSKLLSAADESNLRGPKIRQLQKDFRKLFNLFTQVLCSESFSNELPAEKKVEYLPFDSNVTCSYCRCNIFNRFLTCPHCVGKFVNDEEDYYDICMDCYAMGRSCACISNLKWVEQFKWSDLSGKHESWNEQIHAFSGQKKSSPEQDQPSSFDTERRRLGRRTLAEICQLELRRRPWVDITKPQPHHKEQDEDVNDGDEGERSQKRRKIQRPDKVSKNQARCHICKGFEPSWKLASCSKCDLNYCYGSLFRAFEITPQSVMEDYKWECPKCQKICSCGACRRKTTTTPYEPKGLLLGHDTKKVADSRSVEALVNYSHSNIGWLKKVGDGGSDSNRRLQRHQAEAEMAKMRDTVAGEEEDGLYDHNAQIHDPQVTMYDGIPIDPALA